MNIKGLIKLKESRLPIMKNLVFFKNISEIPKKIIEIHGDKKNWAMRGFDDRIKITDNSYSYDDFRYHNFSRDEFKETFKKINSAMDEKGIPSENRIFIMCDVFNNEDVVFSGHAIFNKGDIHIDILDGNRPSRRDWTPDKSFFIPVVNGREVLISINGEKNEIYFQKIIEDIRMLGKGAYLDFTLLKSGYFFYHDLSFH